MRRLAWWLKPGIHVTPAMVYRPAPPITLTISVDLEVYKEAIEAFDKAIRSSLLLRRPPA